MYTIIVEKKVERFIKSLQKSAQGKVVRQCYPESLMN